MKIKTKLQLIIIAVIILLVGIVSLNLFGKRQTNRQFEQEALIMELHHTTFERTRLRDEYFLYKEERSKEQFLLAHKKIDGLLERLSGTFTGPEENILLNNMRSFHTKIKGFFDQLVRLDESAKDHTALTQALRERIISQMLVNAHSLYRDGRKLLEAANNKIAYQFNIAHLYSNIAFGLLALFIITFTLIIIRSVTYPLIRLYGGTEIIAGGNLDYKTNIRTPDEIGQLSRAFDDMTENLQKVTVSRDDLNKEIEERKRAEEALKASREQMRALAGRLQAVREEERTQIARAIHDELGGALTGLKIDFSLLTRAAINIENETVRTSLLAGMNSMTKFIDATIQTVRRIAMELRPGVLDDLGLVAALEWQLKDFEKRTGIRCEFFPPGEDISLDADLSTALFRIFQEALTNVVRHSGATEVHVRLRADADSSVLEMEDNGKGIEKEKTLSSKSLGLLGMTERAQMFGGRVTVTGIPGIGTTVAVEISPVEKRKMDRDQEGATG